MYELHTWADISLHANIINMYANTVLPSDIHALVEYICVIAIYACVQLTLHSLL